MNEPTNKFREELKQRTISEAEMLERDQRVTYLELKNQAELREDDRLHLIKAVENLKAFGNMVFQLPESEGRTGVLEHNKKHIEQLEKQSKGFVPNRVQDVILRVLEEKFGKAAPPTALVEPPELKDD